MALYRSPLPDKPDIWFRRRSAKYISKTAPMAPSWISDQNDLTLFYLQVTQMLLIKFVVRWPFGSGEE